MSRSVFGILVATLGIALSSTPAAAQFSSSVQGVIEDQSGAVVPGVTVTARNLETQVTAKAATDQRHGCVPFEQPRVRDATKSPPRSASFSRRSTEVRLETAQTAGVNLTLNVAGATEQVAVVVCMGAVVFNPAETRVQTTIPTETLQELPLEGRNFLGLVALGSGITGHGAVGGGAPADAPDNFSTEKTVEASGNGRNQSGNSFTLDGLNVTSNILQGTANLSPNPDSVQEIAIQTNTFSVENGRGSSVQVAITTKAGANDFHGTGSYFFTNENLRARTFFTSKDEPFARHDMSATFGGPIKKNRTFFFASVQPLRSRVSQATSVITFETPEFVNYAKQGVSEHVSAPRCCPTTRSRMSRPRASCRTAASIFGSACGTAATGNVPCSLPMVAQGRFKPSPFRNAIQDSGRVDHDLRKDNDRLYFNFDKVDLDTEQIGRRAGLLWGRQQQHERVPGQLAPYLHAHVVERVQLRSDSRTGQRRRFAGHSVPRARHQHHLPGHRHQRRAGGRRRSSSTTTTGAMSSPGCVARTR